jgi:RHS repeat-associated protein
LSFEQKTYNSGGTLTATTVDSYCYDNADRLSAYNPASGANPFSGLSYDSHGNTVNMGGEIHGYDSADRHVVTKRGSDKIEYVRDASDRIVTRKVNGTTANRYAYTASADTPSLTLDAGGAVVERTLSLPGGVLVTTRGTTTNDVWSYPNLHGDIVATTNGAGLKAGATRAYDPFGNPLGSTAIPDNSAGAMDYGWHGEQQRPLEHQTGFAPLIEMGARQYSPLLGRFLEVDPIVGGNANDYAYVWNPVGMSDLDGNWGWSWKDIKKAARKVSKAAKKAAPYLAIAGLVACTVASAGACAVVGGLGVAAAVAHRGGACLARRRQSFGCYASAAAHVGVDVVLNKIGGKGVRHAVGSALKGRVSQSLRNQMEVSDFTFSSIARATSYCRNCPSVAQSAFQRSATAQLAAYAGGESH